MEFSVVSAGKEHIPQVAALEDKYFSMPWNEKMLENCLDENHIFLVAVSADKVLGYVSIQCVLDEGYFNNIAVDELYRKQGIGQALLVELDKHAIGRELSFITLEVRESNSSARNLYSKNVYTEVGKRKNYYSKPTEDAIIMTKYLK